MTGMTKGYNIVCLDVNQTPWPNARKCYIQLFRKEELSKSITTQSESTSSILSVFFRNSFSASPG